MKRVLLATLAGALCLGSAVLCESDAGAQQPSASQGLPPGHPPISPTPPGSASPADRRGQVQKLLEEQARRKAAAAKEREAAGQPPPSAPPAKKTPTDAHGHCIGQGPDDRPKDINLFHGWLGTRHELGDKGEMWKKAVRPPSPKNGADWWWWRVTPYPYRYDNHEDHCDAENEPVPLIANILNTAILAYVLVRFGRKPLREALSSRKKRIMAEFDRAADIKKNARDRLRTYEGELEHLDDKLDTLRAQYASEAEHEQERVREEMAETRARMLADAEFRITQEGKAARDQLSREALEAALAAAEKLVRESITPDDHRRMARSYLEQIGTALTEQKTSASPYGGRGES